MAVAVAEDGVVAGAEVKVHRPHLWAERIEREMPWETEVLHNDRKIWRTWMTV